MTQAQELPHGHPLKSLEAFATSGGHRVTSDTITIRTDRFFEELAKAAAAIEASQPATPVPMTKAQ